MVINVCVYISEPLPVKGHGIEKNNEVTKTFAEQQMM